MRLAVIDDDYKITDMMQSYLSRFEMENQVQLSVSVFHHPNDFLTQSVWEYDLIFLDIEMPGLNGIETAKEIRRKDARAILIFVTNMAQYAIRGYEVDAIDFVIKPLSYPDFVLKMKKAMRLMIRNQDKKLSLNTTDGVVQISISDLYYVEVIRHYLVFHTLQGEFTVRGVLKELEETLAGHHFVRSNHCYLIHLKYVEEIKGNLIKVGGQQLMISRNKKADFLMKFAKYVGGM